MASMDLELQPPVVRVVQADGEDPVHVPVGATVSASAVGLVAGMTSAKLLQDAWAAPAWVIAAGMCGGLYFLGRSMARNAPGRLRFVALFCLATCTVGYLMVLGGESVPRPAGRGTFDFIVVLATLLATLIASVALPLVILLAAFWPFRSTDRKWEDPGKSSRFVIVALGAAGYLVSLVLFFLAGWISPHKWRPPVMLVVVLVCPVILQWIAALIYERILSRWRVPSPPHALLEGLERLRDLSGFDFDRVVCLNPEFGRGRVCAVVLRPGPSTLVISEPIARMLAPTQLLAVLAHEASHVFLHHGRRRLFWGGVAALVAIASSVAVLVALDPLLPRSIGAARALVVVLPVVFLRALYETFVVRRLEAEADEFAVSIAGGPALLEALQAFGAQGRVLMHNRWTTHSTWERRTRRIAEWEESSDARRP